MRSTRAGIPGSIVPVLVGVLVKQWLSLSRSPLESSTTCMSEDWEHPSPTHVPIKKSKKKRYVIVGAGVAGRACLTQLIQSIQSIQSSSKDSNTSTNTCTYTAKDILLIDPNKDILDSIKSNLSHHHQDQDQEVHVHVETTSLPISKFNIEEQKIEFASGDTVEFEKCLLSMGKETGRIGLDYISPTCSPSHVLHVEANSTENQLEQLRQLVMNNRHVTLLGGSWNSLFIASYLAKYQSSPGLVTMVLPRSGPLHQILPRYLSEALSHRLTKQGVDLLTYTQVRYVGDKETLHLSLNGEGVSGGELQLDGDFVVMHVCCSYDSLRTSMFPTDMVVLSAERDVADGIDRLYSCESFPLSRSWLLQSGLEIDQYGCVVVNKSFLAAENVYVAGDLASFPYAMSSGKEGLMRNSMKYDRSRIDFRRGHDVGLINAEQSGRIAGRNMSDHRGGNVSDAKYTVPFYHAIAPHSGLDFRFFGDCSNEHASHSFWLKSSSLSSSLITKTNKNKDTMVKSNSRSEKNLFSKAGVIFYADSTNIVRGIMLSGVSEAELSPDRGVSPWQKASSNIYSKNISPFDLIGKKIVADSSTLAIEGIGESGISLKYLACGLMTTGADIYIPDTAKINKDRGKGEEKVEAVPSHSHPSLRYKYARPRVLNGNAVTGSKSLLNPSSLSVKGASNVHPWRYSIQASGATEPIFYQRNKNNLN